MPAWFRAAQPGTLHPEPRLPCGCGHFHMTLHESGGDNLMSYRLPVWAIWVALGVTGCGHEAPQGAARQDEMVVSVDRVGIHRLDLEQAVDRLQGVTPENRQWARDKVLASLVDQQLLANVATADKLDKDPKVLAELEAARREVLARALINRRLSDQPPAPAAIEAYYQRHPDLFSHRRIYSLNGLRVSASGPKVALIRSRIESGVSMTQLRQLLSQEGVTAQMQAESKAAEHLPIDLLPRFSGLSAGKLLALPVAGGLLVYEVLASRSDPVSLDKARPLIANFLAHQQRSNQLARLLAELKQKADIQYLGDYARLQAAYGKSDRP